MMQAARTFSFSMPALASGVDAHRLKVDRPSQYFEGDQPPA